jgi:hypothetical protein
MGNRFLDPLSFTMANSGRLSITTLRFLPFSLTDDALTKMICALRSSKQPIDNFSYPNLTNYDFYGWDVWSWNDPAFWKQTAAVAERGGMNTGNLALYSIKLHLQPHFWHPLWMFFVSWMMRIWAWRNYTSLTGMGRILQPRLAMR